jgi:transmembrane sensor
MTDSRQIEQQAADWLVRRDAGDWTAQDQQQLDAWLSASARHKVAFLRLDAAWSEAGRLQALAAGLPAGGPPPRADADTHSLPDLRGIAFAPRRATTQPGRWRHGIAASLALLVAGSAAWGGWQLTGRQEAQYVSTVGQVQTVTLPDGSSATLSSDSRLDVQISRSERHIALTRGEAFFDVAHDTRRPFVVEAQGRRVAAVGTRFSVRHNPDDVRVVVTEGKVRLDSGLAADGRAQPIALLPAGSVATAGRNGVLVQSVPVADAERYLEWRDGFLTFDDTSLADAAAEFNRFNTRKLELGDAAVADLRVGGNFRWSNADGFVRLLEQGFPVRAERHEDRIVLHAR